MFKFFKRTVGYQYFYYFKEILFFSLLTIFYKIYIAVIKSSKKSNLQLMKNNQFILPKMAITIAVHLYIISGKAMRRLVYPGSLFFNFVNLSFLTNLARTLKISSINFLGICWRLTTGFNLDINSFFNSSLILHIQILAAFI